MSARLLLLSNSTAAGFPYLQLWMSTIMSFLKQGAKNVLFFPFAAISLDWDEYTSRVQSALPDLNVTGIHKVADMQAAINTADCIMIGGGNTFNLLSKLQHHGLMQPIRDRCLAGVPYIGWSAGANVATTDIGTTNDMPVVWPEKVEALGLIDFNINPHYSNWKPPGYQGEGRDDRLNEAVIAKQTYIVALSEGVGIWAEDHSVFIIKSHKDHRPEGSELVIKIWKPVPPSGFKVTDVPTDQKEDKFCLDPYLISD